MEEIKEQGLEVRRGERQLGGKEKRIQERR